MRFRGLVASVTMGAMLFASTAFAAAAPPIVGKITCIGAGTNPRITATVPASLSSPRVFFRANAEKTEYYVDMHRRSAGSGEWYAILPPPEPATKTITYRVAGVDDNKQWVVSAPITISAAKSCPSTLTGEEQSMADGIILGLTTAGQSEVPAGFSCRGVTNVIGVDCQMRPAEGCRRLLAQQQAQPTKPGAAAIPAQAVAGAAGAAATAAVVAAGATAAGLSAGVIGALAAAGLAGGLAVFNSGGSKKGGGSGASPSRP
jgi:hypothetical protein